jgi:hypothetical protein
MTGRQPDLFDALPPAPTVPKLPYIRERLHALLTTARAASMMPWDAQGARVNAMLFHNMANWLPEAERDELRAAFANGLARLRAAG